MAILINEHELTDAEIEAELPNFSDSDQPLQRATMAVALRHILLDEAARLGLDIHHEDAAIDALLHSQVRVPQVDDDACRRHYQQQPHRFTVGEQVEVDHILFQITPALALPALRELAEQTLVDLCANPGRFAEYAKRYSNCPSSAVGGHLGQLGRGETVPEFERVVFTMSPGEILPRLLETRFGLHIVRVNRRNEGHLLPYEAVASHIASALHASSLDTAWRQYIQQLVAKARVEGVELSGAVKSPQVQ